ncbi:MAG: FGGY-family carbohydrate kinase [Deltaproteobacteria bacterium]|nr:FGGY-family carbohydrate kinase [Deltaproteobacteria bacterium]
MLAVDLGTSGSKAALVSVSGAVVGWEFEAVETLLFPNGGAEQDPHAWWNAFLQVSKRLIGKGLVAPGQVVAVCCSTQGECTVAVDAGGRPLMNAILWMDMRGASHLQRITGGPIRIAGYHPLRLWRWIRLTGGAPSLAGKDPAAHMLFVKHEHPDVYERTFKFLNALDYLNLRLTGRFVATSDSILTSWVTDNRDPSHVVYSDALLHRCGIAREKFPEIVKCTDVIGRLRPEVAAELGLSADVAVVAGAIDNTAAAVGSGAVRDYEAHLYVGTSSWLAAHVPFKKTDIVSALAALPCAVPGRYLLTALQATAGGNLSFLRDRILYHRDELLQEEKVPDVYKLMDRIAERTPAGSNGVIYAPWIYGERAPVDDANVRAAIFNLSLENSRADIIRAMLEGVALNTRWLLRPFEKFLRRQVRAINLVGGGANSQVWCQIFADVLDRPVRQMKEPIQANVRGAAFIAAVGLGLLSYDDVPERAACQHEYTPTPAHRALYDRYFDEFVQIYTRNKAIYRRLNSTRRAVAARLPR